MPQRTAHVVGRGIIGLSLAFELGRRGWHVIVLGPKARHGTASRAAVGASSMKGRTEAAKPLFTAKMHGHEGLPAWIRDVEERSGRSIRHRFTGLFEPFATVKEFDWIRERVFHKQFTGSLNADLLDRKELVAKGFPEHLLRPEWRGAFYYPHDGWVAPDDLLDALEAAHLKAGGEFQEALVTAIRPQKEGGMILETAGGEVLAAVAVVAAGVFSNEILAASGFVGLEQLAVEGETLVGEEAGPEGDLALRVGKLNYVRAGTEVGVGSTPIERHAGDLEGASAAAFGWGKISARKWGIRGRFRDRIPAIGQLFFPGHSTGPWVSLGYYKSGIQLSHLFAQNLVSLIEGAPPAPAFHPFLVGRLSAFSTPSR